MAAKVVLITGCSKGIGKETALQLAKDPRRRFKVYATMRNMVTKQDSLKTEAGSVLDDTLFIRELDVTKQETIDKTVKEIIDEEGVIDVLVNNAGLATPFWWQTAAMETFYDVMEVNYFGCVRMTRAVVPQMKMQRNGRIIQISSTVGFRAIPANAQYVSSKFALEGFSEAIAPPLRTFNVWVSLIEPGFTSTEMTEKYAKNGNEFWRKRCQEIPGDDSKIVENMLTSDSDEAPNQQYQPVGEVATLIKEVILSPKPDFRNPTSDSAKEAARARFKDASGRETIDTWLKQ